MKLAPANFPFPTVSRGEPESQHLPRDRKAFESGSSATFFSLLLFFVTYVIGAGLGQGLAILPEVTVTYWPPAGIFLAALLLTRASDWYLFVFTGCAAELLANYFWFKSPGLFALGFYGGNALEALTAAYLIRCFIRRSFRLDSLEQVGALVLLGGIIAPCVGATVISALAHVQKGTAFWKTWPLVWLGDASGVLATTPIALVAVQTWNQRRGIRWVRLAEALIVFCLLGVVALAALRYHLDALFLTLPVLLWAALRFQLRGGAVALACAAILCAAFAAPTWYQRTYPLTPALLHERAVFIQLFLAVASASTLLVAALSQQHRHALERLRSTNQLLETRVDERTAGLRKSEASLRESEASLRESEASLRESEARMRLFIEHAPVGIAMFDRQMRYLAVSRRWREDYGVGGCDLIGRCHYEVFPDLPEHCVAAHRRGLAGEGTRCEADRFDLPDGQVQYTRWEILPWYDSTGEVGGILFAAENITARKAADDELRRARERAEQALRAAQEAHAQTEAARAQAEEARVQAEAARAQAEEARAQAEAATRAKDDFLARLSHELRTPLTPVLMLLSHHTESVGLQRDDGDDSKDSELRRDLAEIKRNVETEIRLIDDLLDLTRVVTGKLVLRDEAVDMHTVIRRAVSVCCDELWHAKGLRLLTRTQAQHPVVLGDPTRLEQVIWNLLRNAFKFTPPGGTVRIDTRNPDPNYLRIDIEDTGIGITPESLARIFNSFEQGNPEVTAKFGGLGMGLTICRTLVEMHGGTIRAESEGRDLGSRFVIHLPVAQHAEVEHADPQSLSSGQARPDTLHSPAGEYAFKAPSPGSQSSPARRILLVEDDETTRRVLSRLLTIAGHDVTTAPTITDALRLARSQAFDLVISDLGLPDGRGHELMQQLQADAALTHLPGIALSGFGTEQDVQMSLAAGFSDHLVKPVNLQRITQAIDRLADPRRPELSNAGG